MTPPDDAPTRSDTPGEVIGVRRGLFGVRGSGDTSGYGRLIRPITLPGSTPRPYGGYFDEVVDILGQALEKADTPVDIFDALEKIVVYREELTLHVLAAYLPVIAQTLRDEPGLRFELCLGVSGVHYPDETGRELHAVYPLMSITHNRRVRLESPFPTPIPTSRRSTRSTPPPTGTNARPTTSSASSSTATRR